MAGQDQRRLIPEGSVDDNELGMAKPPDRDPSRTEDAALVDAARRGDADAFGALYERWFARVYDLAYRITRDEQSAGDVVQDAFLSAWRALGNLEALKRQRVEELRTQARRKLDARRIEEIAEDAGKELMRVVERVAERVDSIVGRAPGAASKEGEASDTHADSTPPAAEPDGGKRVRVEGDEH